MKTKNTAYNNANKLMNDFILRKYAINIRKAINSLHIYPKDYKLRLNNGKRWMVVLQYKLEGKPKRIDRSSFESAGQKISVKSIKNHKERIEAIEHLKEGMAYELRSNPKIILKILYGEEKAKELYPSVYEPLEVSIEKKVISIEEAMEEALESKKGTISNTYYINLKSIRNKFIKYLGSSSKDTVGLITKKLLVRFIDEESKGKSNTTRNNIKTAISVLLTKMIDLEHIDINPIEGMKNLKSNPKIHRAYNNDEYEAVVEELKKQPLLYYYKLHVYYALMRPQTVVRLKVKHVDLGNRLFKKMTKTGDYVSSIPKFLMDECYSKLDFTNADPEMYIFGRNKMIDFWDAADESRRGTYSLKFKPIKEKLNLDKDLDWYSFRHRAIGVMFDNVYKDYKEKKYPDYKNKALDYISQFTNHKTREQTLKYLRGVSMHIHVDSSEYL